MGNLNGDKDVSMTRHGPVITMSVLLLTASVLILPRDATALVLSHWDLEGANLTCDGRSTCALPPGARSPRLDQDVDWRDRNCMCDGLCAQYGDCCLDAPFFVAAQQRRGAATFSCVELRQFGGVYMRATCPPGWVDADVRALCEAEGDSAADPVRSVPVTSRASGITYRNAHCALCHGDLDGAEFWNPHLECLGILQQTNISSEEAAQALVYNDERRSWGLNLSSYGFQPCLVDPYIPDTAQGVVRRCEAGVVRTCAVNWTNADLRVRCEAYTAHVFRGADGFRNPHCAMCNNVPVQELMCSRTLYRTMYHKEFVPGAFAVLFDLYGGGGNLVGQQQPCHGRHELYDPFFKRCRNVFCSGNNQDYADGKCVAVVPPSEDDDDDESQTDATASGNTTQPVLTATPPTTTTTTTTSNDSFSTCPKFVLELEDFVVLGEDLDNATVRVATYGRDFPPGRYRVLPDGRLEICATSLGTAYVRKFGPHMGYVTFAGLGVSVVFLLLHLAAFAAIPDLRNLSGKNLASLCVSLLCGYCAFMAGQVIFPSGSTASCTSAAVLTHYGFLAAFLWSLAMAFDVWRTLRLATSELRVSAGKQWRKFAVYSGVCWTTPLVFVLAALLTDAAPPHAVDDAFRPAFAVFSCWFGHRKALLAFFAAPLAVVMVCNVAFFVSSARMIFATTSNTRFSTGGSGGAHRDFRLYVRLAVVMGLTWAVGLLAGYLDLEGLWYAFVALNTLQGLFVFLAFTCTDKVARAIADAVRRHKVAPGCVHGVHSVSGGGGLAPSGRNGAPPSLSWSGSDSTRKSHVGGSDSRETSDTLY